MSVGEPAGSRLKAVKRISVGSTASHTSYLKSNFMECLKNVSSYKDYHTI